MKEIPLTKGQVVIVDDEDYLSLAQWKWHAFWVPLLGGFYAARGVKVNGRSITVLMHRQLLGLEKGDKQVVDHINHNTLDNWRSNLRKCTHVQNLWNMRKHRNNTSGHTGVGWCKLTNKWFAAMRINGKSTCLGRFDSLEEAIAARKARAIEIRGEYYSEIAG